MSSIVYRCRQRIKDNKLSVGLLNIQSMAAHHEDLVSDPVLNKTDILALTETWMKDDEPSMEIPAYTIVARHNSSSTRAGGVAIYESIKPYLKCCTHFQLDTTNAPYGDVCCVRVEFKNTQGLNDKLHILSLIHI